MAGAGGDNEVGDALSLLDVLSKAQFLTLWQAREGLLTGTRTAWFAPGGQDCTLRVQRLEDLELLEQRMGRNGMTVNITTLGLQVLALMSVFEVIERPRRR